MTQTLTSETAHPLAYALWLQSRHGIAVFPLDHPGLPECAGRHRENQPCNGTRGKHPACWWPGDASNDPHVVRRSFSRDLRNIGVACQKSGLLVVDEDKPGAFLQYATEVDQVIPPTFTVTTSKGQHFYFHLPAGEQLGNGVGALTGRGIDIRGNGGARNNGGYVVGPGSIHETGVMYTPVDPSAVILPAPAWLIAALQAEPPPKFPQPQSGGFDWGQFRQPGGGRSALKTLTGLVRVVLDATPGTRSSPGDRNIRLYWAACRAFEHVDAGLFSDGQARGALLDAARCVGLPDGEINATLSSARTRIQGGGTR